MPSLSTQPRIFFVLAVVSFLFVFCATQSRAANKFVTRGNEELSSGNYEKALSCFKTAIIQDVMDEDAWSGYRRAAAKQALAGHPKSAPASAKETPRKIHTNPGAEPTRVKAAPAETSAPHAVSKVKIPKIPSVKYKVDDAEFDRAMRALIGDDDTDNGGPRTERNERPWFGLPVFETVDHTALESVSRSERLFEEQKKKCMFTKKRRYNGIAEITAVYFSMDLYKYLAVAQGALKGWSYKETDMNYVLMSRKARHNHEFTITITNLSSPRKHPFIQDIGKRTYLIDDAGNRYEPAEYTKPKDARLKETAQYSVFFRKIDSSGRNIISRAKRWFFLVVEGLDRTNSKIRIRIPKDTLVL